MKLLFFLIIGIMCTGMPLTDDKQVELNKEFELGLKEAGNVRTECIKVVFESVQEDSRCPTGVNCVWSGNAVVRVKVSKNGEEEVLDLNTDLQPSSRSYKGFEVSLKKLSPYPKEGVGIINEDYKAVLLIRK